MEIRTPSTQLIIHREYRDFELISVHASVHESLISLCTAQTNMRDGTESKATWWHAEFSQSVSSEGWQSNNSCMPSFSLYYLLLIVFIRLSHMKWKQPGGLVQTTLPQMPHQSSQGPCRYKETQRWHEGLSGVTLWCDSLGSEFESSFCHSVDILQGRS